jgi:hypothetical protein
VRTLGLGAETLLAIRLVVGVVASRAREGDAGVAPVRPVFRYRVGPGCESVPDVAMPAADAIRS